MIQKTWNIYVEYFSPLRLVTKATLIRKLWQEEGGREQEKGKRGTLKSIKLNTQKETRLSHARGKTLAKLGASWA